MEVLIMTPQIISLIITGLALILIAVQVIVGAVRGLKKSVFRLIWIFGWGVVCILIAGLVAKAIVNMDISFLHINVNGTQITTLPAYIQQMMESSNPDIAAMIADNPKIMELCTSIAAMIFSLVIFEILFWGTKLLLWPVWAILSHKFYGEKKAKKESPSVAKSEPAQPTAENGQEPKIIRKPVINQKVTEPKKHGGFGALVGLGLGLLVCMFTFIPLASINNAILKVEAETATEQSDGTTKGLVSQMLGEKSQFLYVYENSYLNLAFKYTGLGLVQSGASRLITTTRFNGSTFNFDAEVENLAPAYKDYLIVKDKDFNNLSKADIEEILPAVDDAQKRVLSSGIVKSVYEELVPYVAKNILTRSDYFIQLPHFENDLINNVMKDIIRAFCGISAENEIDYSKVIKISDVSKDLSTVVEIAGQVNDADLLADLLYAGFDFDDLQLKLNEKTAEIKELGNDIVDKAFEMKTISTVIDVAFEPAIKYAIDLIPTFEYEGDDVKVVYTAVDGGVQIDGLKSFMKLLVENGVDIAKNIDKTSKIYIDTQNFANVGAILDYVKNTEEAKIISTATYNSIINYGKTYATKLVKEQEIRQELKDAAYDAINTISSIQNFETELGYFGQAYKLYDEAESVDEVLVCKMLDKVKLTEIYALNIDNIISKANNIAVGYVNDNNLPFATNNIQTILNSVKTVDSFEAEWAKINPVYVFVRGLVDGGHFEDDIMQQANLQALGNKLDTAIASDSVLLSDANCKLVINSFVSELTLPEMIAPYKTTIMNNINNIVSYEAELVAVSNALSIKDITSTDRQKFVDIGVVLDEIKNSALFGGNLIKNIIVDYYTEETESITIDNCLQTAIDHALSNISNELNYTEELGYIYDLIHANISDIASFKAYLQNGLLDVDGNSKSGIITNDVLYDALVGVAGEITIADIDIMDDVIEQLEQDRTDQASILDVVSQLEGLEAKINNLKAVPNASDMDSTYLTNLGKEIDDLDDDFGLIFNANAVEKIGNYVAELINQKVQDSGLDQGKKDAVDAIYQARDGYSSFETMFGAYATALGL